MDVFQLRNISVHHKLHAGKDTRLARLFLRRKKEYERVHRALDDVSVAIADAEVFGLIGRNGAGKSTLLKVLAGVIYPSCGVVWRNPEKRVFPLLSLGVGFFPDLTGRENCYLSGALMGLSKKGVAEHIQGMESFADIGKYFDEPVKTYSSGMYSRLAFSVATSINADVLLLDEVLGVGDMRFAMKSAARLQSIITSGVTVVIVSHNVDYLTTVCTRMAWMHEGKIAALGSPPEVAKEYRSAMRAFPA